MRKSIKSDDPWAPFNKIQAAVFERADLSSMELVLLCYLAGRYSKREKRFLYTSHRRICNTLGLARGHVRRLLKSLITKGVVVEKPGALPKSPKFYECQLVKKGTPYLAVPAVIIEDDSLKPYEKLVLVVSLSFHKLHIHSKADFAKATKMDKRTLTKTLTFLEGLHIIETHLNPLGVPTPRPQWKPIRPAHKVKQAVQWAKIKQNPVFKQQYMELVMKDKAAKERQEEINKNILFVSELIYARRKAPTPPLENFVNYYRPRGAPLEELNPREAPLSITA